MRTLTLEQARKARQDTYKAFNDAQKAYSDASDVYAAASKAYNDARRTSARISLNASLIWDRGLPLGARKALGLAGINIAEECCLKRPRELLALRGIGPKGLSDIKQALATRGLALRGEKAP